MTIILATLPGLLICYAMFRADKYEREPLGPLVFSFAAGAMITIPAIRVEQWVMDAYNLKEHRNLGENFLLAFGVVALWEEALKMLVLLAVFPRRFFNEPIDGIVYAVMIGMGFATFENIAYMERFGDQSLFIRAFTAIPAHLVFAVIQGYFAGKAKFLFKEKDNRHERRRLMGNGFFISFFMHGVYDLLIFQDRWQWLFMLATSATYLCLFYASELIREHLDNSPFRKGE